MKVESFTSDEIGELVRLPLPDGALADGSTHAWGFLPKPPPASLQLDESLHVFLSNASHSVGRLDGLGTYSPVSSQFLIPVLIRREAVSSSRIEGTETDLEQLLTFEEEGDNSPSDAQEVLNYVRALEYGLNRGDGRNISPSLICELHALLLKNVRGSDLNPGRYREGVVYIGNPRRGIQNARFVPPPPDQVPGLMLDLESWLLAPSQIPHLARLAIYHYQFEAIHPFSDGNGRTGRLLLPLLLGSWGLLSQPYLYLSRFIERHKDDYMDGLLKVSQTGNWNEWIQFILDAIISESFTTTRLIQDLVALKLEYRDRYRSVRGYYVADAIDMIFERPVIRIRRLSETLGIAYNTARQFVETLELDGVLTVASHRKRDRVFLAQEIIGLVNRD